jgi:hypothetical protein
LYGGFACLHRSLPKKANRSGEFPRDEKPGGFQPPLPLYLLEPHLSGAKQRGVAQMDQCKDQELKQEQV